MITLGNGDYQEYDSDYYAGLVNEFSTTTINGQQYMSLATFGFGQWDNETNVGYFVDMLNSNETLFGAQANYSQASLAFRGVGLPGPLFWKFASLLQSTITEYE